MWSEVIIDTGNQSNLSISPTLYLILCLLLDLSRTFPLLMINVFPFSLIFLSFLINFTITTSPFLYPDGGCLFSCLNTTLSEDLFWLPWAFTNIWSISFFQSFSKLGSSFNPWDVGNISKAVILPLDCRPKKKTLNGDRPPSDWCAPVLYFQD